MACCVVQLLLTQGCCCCCGCGVLMLLLLQVLQLLIRLYEDCAEPDYSVICQCLMFLDDAPGVAKILNKLISSSGVSEGERERDEQCRGKRGTHWQQQQPSNGTQATT